MKVKELIEKLSIMNPDARVLFDTEAGQFTAHMAEVDRAFEESAEASPDGKPYVSLHSDAERRHGLLGKLEEFHADADKFVAKFKEVLEAWKILQEDDSHPDGCGLAVAPMGAFGYAIESPCTCGKHERKEAARKRLDDTARAILEPSRG